MAFHQRLDDLVIVWIDAVRSFDVQSTFLSPLQVRLINISIFISNGALHALFVDVRTVFDYGQNLGSKIGEDGVRRGADGLGEVAVWRQETGLVERDRVSLETSQAIQAT